ncbi:hypothetical protein C5142_16390 [Rhodococcus sp. BGS-1C]|jgi:hypothetical protein|uniref:hypothetical protein n=1 Tax=Rhodococcus sp. BGS-1C TaxID=2100132 RepID=UPI0030F9C9B2
MDLSRGQALNAASTAAKLVADADDTLHRSKDRERDDDFDRVKQTLDEAEKANMSTRRDLDGDRVGEIRSLLAEGGDKAVAKKFGESALVSPEAVKAKSQRAAIRKHESTMAREAISTATIENEQKTVTAAQQLSRTPLRDQAVARQLHKDGKNSRREQSAPTGQRSRTPLRDQAIERQRQKDRDREDNSLGR